MSVTLPTRHDATKRTGASLPFSVRGGGRGAGVAAPSTLFSCRILRSVCAWHRRKHPTTILLTAQKLRDGFRLEAVVTALSESSDQFLNCDAGRRRVLQQPKRNHCPVWTAGLELMSLVGSRDRRRGLAGLTGRLLPFFTTDTLENFLRSSKSLKVGGQRGDLGFQRVDGFLDVVRARHADTVTEKADIRKTPGRNFCSDVRLKSSTNAITSISASAQLGSRQRVPVVLSRNAQTQASERISASSADNLRGCSRMLVEPPMTTLCGNSDHPEERSGCAPSVAILLQQLVAPPGLEPGRL